MNILTSILTSIRQHTFRQGFQWACYEHLHNNLELYEIEAALSNPPINDFERGALAALRELSSIQNGASS